MNEQLEFDMLQNTSVDIIEEPKLTIEDMYKFGNDGEKQFYNCLSEDLKKIIRPYNTIIKTNPDLAMFYNNQPLIYIEIETLKRELSDPFDVLADTTAFKLRCFKRREWELTQNPTKTFYICQDLISRFFLGIKAIHIIENCNIYTEKVKKYNGMKDTAFYDLRGVRDKIIFDSYKPINLEKELLKEYNLLIEKMKIKI